MSDSTRNALTPSPSPEGKGETPALKSFLSLGRSGNVLSLAAGIGAVALTAAAFTLVEPARSQTAPGETEAGALQTFAGIPPVAYLVKRIGGPHVRVEALVQPGQDPHIFELTPRQVVRLGAAKLFFKVGMPFEGRLAERIAASDVRTTIIDTAAGIKRRAGVDPDEDAGADPHVWLAPRLLKQMAANIEAALSAADPPHTREYRASAAALDAELDALDRRLDASLASDRGRSFYVFHPAFGYFADAYHLRQESVEIEGKSPTPRQLVQLVRQARTDGVKIIFLQPQFNQQMAASIAQSLGGAVMPMDDLAYDVVTNLGEVATKIAAANNDARVACEPKY
jgi:zinc transport system substrate-binding protein